MRDEEEEEERKRRKVHNLRDRPSETERGRIYDRMKVRELETEKEIKKVTLQERPSE